MGIIVGSGCHFLFYFCEISKLEKRGDSIEKENKKDGSSDCYYDLGRLLLLVLYVDRVFN